MSHGLVPFSVTHKRLVPKPYEFTHGVFWFKLELEYIDELPSWMVSRNKFNFYNFKDSDHVKFNKESARENYIEFARQNGVTSEIVSVALYTQLRFLGYVFNPVSFILLKDVDGKDYAIIEVGNTFNEIKPYFVPNEKFKGDGFSITTKKFFYISPFIDHDNEMTFHFRNDDGRMKIYVEDKKEEEKVLQVWFDGKEIPFTNSALIKQTLKFPFVTLKIIFLIHYHAMILWLKGIPFYKKEENKHLQKGAKVWKTSNNS